MTEGEQAIICGLSELTDDSSDVVEDARDVSFIFQMSRKPVDEPLSGYDRERLMTLAWSLREHLPANLIVLAVMKGGVS